ncbi:MAG: hypothetical protein SVY10_11950, partial [Thermodesulfobacteriota bacterium]|nr:hypothetical protein [Thermodesulfobacteriota bacterium]
RDRVILYLGAEKNERGRLILYNLTQQKKRLLTPKDLVVLDFEPFSQGDTTFSLKAILKTILIVKEFYIKNSSFS